jgi:hypothetical protein
VPHSTKPSTRICGKHQHRGCYRACRRLLRRHTYRGLSAALNPLGLACLHIAESPDSELTAKPRALWDATLILNPFTPGAYSSPSSSG